MLLIVEPIKSDGKGGEKSFVGTTRLCVSEIECQSLEQLKEYLEDKKSVEAPDDWTVHVSEFPYLDGEEGRKARINASRRLGCSGGPP